MHSVRHLIIRVTTKDNTGVTDTENQHFHTLFGLHLHSNFKYPTKIPSKLKTIIDIHAC